MTNNAPSCPKAIMDVLKTIPDARAFIATELRDMAMGHKEYSDMPTRSMPPWCRHIWLAAAEMLLNENL